MVSTWSRAAAADGDDQPAAVGELAEQLRRHLVGGGRHEDAVERRLLVPAPGAVADGQVHVVRSRGGRASRGRAPRAERAARPRRPRPRPRPAPPSGSRCRRRSPARGERTSTSSSDGHERDHVRLRDGLAEADGQRRVGVGLGRRLPRHEEVARHRAHRRQDVLVAQAAPHELLLDHAQPAHPDVGGVSAHRRLRRSHRTAGDGPRWAHVARLRPRAPGGRATGGDGGHVSRLLADGAAAPACVRRRLAARRGAAAARRRTRRAAPPAVRRICLYLDRRRSPTRQ